MTIPPKAALEAIVFQSDLMGLSAAVEAAGAGPSRAAFATAATELQRLAQTVKATARLIEKSAHPLRPNS